MCGIFALLNNENQFKENFIKEQFQKGKNRGPEHSILVNNVKSVFGFHRLAINGLNSISNQPIVIHDVSLICNGEIYNYKELYSLMKMEGKTQSDCEVIIHLYLKYGIEQTLTMIHGVFSFILLDNRICENDLTSKIYVARDPFGVRPLYLFQRIKDTRNNYHYDYSIIGFASEMKVLSSFYDTLNIDNEYSLKAFTPGTYSHYTLSNKVISYWEPVVENKCYFVPNSPNLFYNPDYEFNVSEIMYNIEKLLTESVYKRCLTTERPIACLLSGGLDSSLIASIVSNFYKENYGMNKLETYSIGLVGSEDLKYARIVADYIGSKHTEIIVTEKEMFEAIPEVIYAIESYDTTTVRASIGNYLIGKYISLFSEAKVIFNGDGSDEVCGGYLYMNSCPDSIEFDKETRRLLKDIHLYDVLRSDKCISSHGLEPRTPFLDKKFVNYYLSIAPIIRSNEYFKKKNISSLCEKYLLRESFSGKNSYSYFEKQILPDEILWRKKEAFSDGVSNNNRSLYQILQEFIFKDLSNNNNNNNNDFFKQKNSHLFTFGVNLETEKYYYKSIFEKFYPNLTNIIPYYWMPKYVDSNDPSARTLSIYKNNDKNSSDKLYL